MVRIILGICLMSKERDTMFLNNQVLVVGEDKRRERVYIYLFADQEESTERKLFVS